MSNPLFSIIIPTHNGEERISHAIASIKCQSFKDWEVIFVLDNCTDDTATAITNMWIDEHQPDNVRAVSVNENRDGLARNAGLDIAQGEWILFMDDDDHFMHEYCLEQIADAIRLHGRDVDTIDFDFLWKGQGIKTPSDMERFVMAWCRAWKRSFIGNDRFNDLPYGSDKDFFVRKIQDNPDVRIYDLHSVIYYYNYMREGSLSWNEKQHKLLDIVVTHYNEPWNVCKPFFDMLSLQRNVDFSQISVILVQDLNGIRLDWPELLHDYPYHVQVITSQDNSHPRNDGFSAGNADWVMFCDIDDMFADVCSLRMILDQFPVHDYDMIWMKCINEQRWNASTTMLNRVDETNLSSVVGKIYRRQFLQEKNITFSSFQPLYADYIFNSIVSAETQPFRIVSLSTDFYVYCKTYRPDGRSHRIENQLHFIEDRFVRDIFLAQEFLNRGLTYARNKALMSALIADYFTVYDPSAQPVPAINNAWATHFAQENASALSALTPSEIDVVRDMMDTETMNYIQRIYNDHKVEYYLVNDTIRRPFAEWLQSVMPVPEPEPVVVSDHTPHVAVYCGTANTYLNMLTSAKSLLYHTPMDKIYFLIEDDTFPYEIPDIIECINVKNQTFFPHDGPNFDNAWSYMCLMRAAFPKIIPYDTILSLDIDVIIQENISALWDYDLSNAYLAGVTEPARQKSSADPPYINFGVVMMNLNKLRTDGKDDEIIHALNTTKFGCPEQDAFNKLCANHIITIPNDYNATVHSHITGDAQHERIIHYAGIKFWRHYGPVKEYADKSWDSIMQRQNIMKAGDIHEG